MSYKPVASGKSDAGCHRQPARHHTMTFNENDPNRWLAPNTNNCINLLNKFKKGGAPCLFTSNQNSYRLQLNKWQAEPGQQAAWGSDGLNRKATQVPHKERASRAPYTTCLPLSCIWEGEDILPRSSLLPFVSSSNLYLSNKEKFQWRRGCPQFPSNILHTLWRGVITLIASVANWVLITSNASQF